MTAAALEFYPAMRSLLLAVLLAPLPIIAGDPFAWQLQHDNSMRATSSLQSPREFEAVALSWQHDPAADSDQPHVRLRASADGENWGEWIQTGINEDLTDRSRGEYFTNIVHFGRSYQHVEYQIEGHAKPRAMTLTLFAAPPQRRARIEATSIAYGNVNVRTRTEWGCPDGQGSRWTPVYTTVTHEIVHHTAGSNTLVDWENEVRNIWFFHTVTRGWGDIGYNFLIDPNGVVYEGRAGGLGAIGAHFSCRNTNTVGIALLGDFTLVAPTAAALARLDELLEELARRHALDPQGTTLHAPSGLSLPTVSGHRDANASPAACSATSCPGDTFYRMLPSVRAQLSTCAEVSIIQHPASRTAPAGTPVILSVAAAGAEPLTYQWYSGNSGDTSNPIAGATSHSLSIALSDATYWVRVSNECGTADSSPATLTIGTAPQRKRTGRP